MILPALSIQLGENSIGEKYLQTGLAQLKNKDDGSLDADGSMTNTFSTERAKKNFRNYDLHVFLRDAQCAEHHKGLKNYDGNFFGQQYFPEHFSLFTNLSG